MTYTGPKPYYITCTVTPQGKNALTQQSTHRVGFASDLDAAQRLIYDDKNYFIAETWIMEKDKSKRHYRIFKAAWTEIEFEKAGA